MAAAPHGERLRSGVPHGHWRTTTFVAGLRLAGMAAPMVLDGPISAWSAVKNVHAGDTALTQGTGGVSLFSGAVRVGFGRYGYLDNFLRR
jgi:hypothetical protein